MFKFDFQQNDEDLNDYFCNADQKVSPLDESSDNICIPCNDFEEIHASSCQVNRSVISNVIYGHMSFAGHEEVRYIRMDDQEEILLDMKNDHTDLMPGIYEGGGKIWECTQDLGDYFMKPANEDDSLFKNVRGKRVLDLGCGAGILGILALKGKAVVDFSDYNSSILSALTIENVLLNFQETKSATLKRCKFYAGDWSKYIEATANDSKYDLIMSSETIYNPENYWKILDVLKSKLKTDGIALIAAKTYYFGVGGGCRDFEKFIKNDGNFISEVALILTENVQREILKLKFVNRPH